MDRALTFNTIQTINCCVCDAAIQVNTYRKYETDSQLGTTSFYTSQNNLYFICCIDCDNKFALTPILYKPLNRNTYTIE